MLHTHHQSSRPGKIGPFEASPNGLHLITFLQHRKGSAHHSYLKIIMSQPVPLPSPRSKVFANIANYKWLCQTLPGSKGKLSKYSIRITMFYNEPNMLDYFKYANRNHTNSGATKITMMFHFNCSVHKVKLSL
jgi:hypothetical protein